MLNAPQILFDFSYDQYMDKKLSHYTAKHFEYFFGENRKDHSPFDAHICNADSNTTSMQALLKYLPILGGVSCPVEIHRKCYSELHPRENLVYLTPYSPNVLVDFNPNDVYVIGAVVDRGENGPITLMKARELGIRTAWLPISQYIIWRHKHKSLPLNIVGDIMRDFKNTRDWSTALAHVPQRLKRPSREGRPMQHRMASEMSEPSGVMPCRPRWDEIHDQTMAMDHVTGGAKSNLFKRNVDFDDNDDDHWNGSR